MRYVPCPSRYLVAMWLVTLAAVRASLAGPAVPYSPESGPVIAQFELRLAPTSPDAVLDIDDPADMQLDLELWITLSNGPLPGNAMGYSFQLVPSLDGVISYAAGSFANTVPFDPPQIQGIDNRDAANQPLSGAFSRGTFSIYGVPMSLGPNKVATFSVTAVAPGQVDYSFLASPPTRPWNFSFMPYDVPGSALASPAMTITVIPEPASAATAALFLGWVARRRARHGCRR